jgi:ADP-ribose pyrophosphatase
MSEQGPEDRLPEAGPEVIGSREIFRGKVINLRVDQIALSGGRTATREVVEYPGAVVVIAVDEEGRVTLVRQWRHAIARFLLEFPAGGLERGEEPLKCAKRELREETGLEAERWTPVGYFFSSPGFANEILHVFLAEDLREVLADPDEDEDLQVIRCTLSDLYEHPEQLEDAKSLAALLLLQKAGDGGKLCESEYRPRSGKKSTGSL